MRIGVAGSGAVGARVVRHLHAESKIQPPPASKTAPQKLTVHELSRNFRKRSRKVDIAVLATPNPVSWAAQLLAQGTSVVTTSGGLKEVENLLTLDGLAKKNDALLVASAAFSPGLSCLLVAKVAAEFQLVEEIHVARAGTGGRACAKSYHNSLRLRGLEWHEGQWCSRQGGSGRDLCWFPDPVGPVDCYRAALPEPLLLQTAFPKARKIGARRAATRRDRLTAGLPMLTPPPAEGGVGAVRVEVRGQLDGQPTQKIIGAAARPAIAAAALATQVSLMLAKGEITATGATGLAGLVDPIPLLKEVRSHGITLWQYAGHDF